VIRFESFDFAQSYYNELRNVAIEVMRAKIAIGFTKLPLLQETTLKEKITRSIYNFDSAINNFHEKLYNISMDLVSKKHPNFRIMYTRLFKNLCLWS